MFDHDDYELHEAQKHACRMAKERDEALLRQALEALELRCGTNADERKELIPALRERVANAVGSLI